MSFGSYNILDAINLQIHEKEKICLLGRNGAGKTSLMKLIDGGLEPDSGSIVRKKELKTALLTQEILNDWTGKVYTIVAEGITSIHSIEQHLDSYEEQKTRQRIERAISLLALDPEALFENLSVGMKRQVLLGRAIVDEPDVLLLDEPTNHLDIKSIEWLENFLNRYDKTIFFVTHDRAFLQRIAHRILELDRGKLFDWQCDYKTFLKRKDAWLESEETQNQLFDKRLAKEEKWIRMGIKARRKRNEGRVRALEKMRDEKANRRDRQGNVRLEMRSMEKSGAMIIEAKDISFSYDSSKLIENFSTRILRGDKIGILGSNGCGKTTLIKILLKELEPNSGKVKLGTRIEKAYFDQLRNRLDESRTVRHNAANGTDFITSGSKKKHVIGYLQDFLFTPDRADIQVKQLSGGERNRLLLAKLFARSFNFLIMDEPTNDLDIETIELLEELLLEFKGTLLLVSHDREFINNIVTTSFAFEGDGIITELIGGYDDWLRIKKTGAKIEFKSKGKKREKTATSKRKLSFKEKRELNAIPREIEKMEERKKEIFRLLGDSSIYREGGLGVTDMKEELVILDQDLAIRYARWQELDAVEDR